jgi:4-hydroxybenzoate polyprenyltransferase
LVLATAADHRWAQAVADSTGVFEDVLASSPSVNLKGRAKLEAIERYCETRGWQGFDYVGDSLADLPIWEKAERAFVVAGSPRVVRRLRGRRTPLQVVGGAENARGAAFRALRPAQWVKNLLLFAPLALAHEFSSGDKLLAAVLAFVAFCLCASSVYVVNDLLDLDADRRHPRKRRRPFAAGTLPVARGPWLAMGCAGLGLSVALLSLPPAFTAVLMGYMILTSLYSGWVKRVVLADVVLLSGLYTIRVLAGGLATGVPVSEWLLVFSMFFFLSLAFAKRYSELSRLREEDVSSTHGRGYRAEDWSLLESIGPTSGYLAVLVFALYAHSEHMASLYANGWALWLICPLLIYWISRVWLKAKRRELTEDPVLFAVRDRVSVLLGIVVLLLVMVAAPL